MDEPFKVPFHNRLRRCRETVIADKRCSSAADDRRRIPARILQFRRNQMKLVFEVGRPCIGGNFERVIVYAKSQSNTAPGGNLVELFLSEITNPAGDQRERAGPGK